MTVVADAPIHDLRELVVGDLVLRVAPPGKRTTIQITVERDASLGLKAPPDTTIERATQFVVAKRQWVYRKLAEKDAIGGPPVTKQFVEGEGFTYLGRSYRLAISEQTTEVRLERGRFHINPAQTAQGTAAMRRWYIATGTRWLQKRIRPWATRMGNDTVSVTVRDLGYRWGSARPTEGPQRINVHWAAFQLPPSLIDYICVHELAHLHEANHTPDFWAKVARTMPTYETQKTKLAAYGKTTWLGAVTERQTK
ncbi:MAG: SprT family zinc-dependent metalloprotease [bacterium]|nr:SprT family zinc-dependent metalloprotease [bacterium]